MSILRRDSPHGLNSYATGSRVSHYDEGSYRYYFPIDERIHQSAYEIDESMTQFINICTLQDLDEYSDEEKQLANEFSSKAIIADGSTKSSLEDMYEAAQETVIIQLDENNAFEEKSIKFAILDCVMDHVVEIQKYLQNSLDASIFLQGMDCNDDTALIMTSRENSSAMVSLLLDHGSDVNAVNDEGRNALMEAALWRRLDNV